MKHELIRRNQATDRADLQFGIKLSIREHRNFRERAFHQSSQHTTNIGRQNVFRIRQPLAVWNYLGILAQSFFIAVPIASPMR